MAYRIAELPPPDPSWNSEAKCLNEQGVVGGTISPNFVYEGEVEEDIFHSRATIWPTPSTPQPIDAITDPYSAILDINDNGDAVGTSSPPPFQTRTLGAFLLRSGSLIGLDSVITKLGPKGFNGAQARGINNGGQVVGYVGDIGFLYDLAGGTASAVVASATGKIASEADAINEAGDIAGMNQDPIPEGFVNSGGTFAGLGRYFYPQAMNDSGKVISTNRFAICDTTTTPATFTPIPVPPGLFAGVAWGLNNLGDVVGDCTDASGTMFAFVSNGLVSWDLNTLIPANSGWHLTIAQDINDRGQIVGTGLLNGQTRGFLLTPLPGPPLRPPHRVPQSSILDALITILGFAPIDGPGGSVVIRGGKPVPVGPVGPQGGYTAAKVDVLISLAIDELASRLSGREQAGIRRSALENVRRQAEILLGRVGRE